MLHPVTRPVSLPAIMHLAREPALPSKDARISVFQPAILSIRCRAGMTVYALGIVAPGAVHAWGHASHQPKRRQLALERPEVVLVAAAGTVGTGRSQVVDV